MSQIRNAASIIFLSMRSLINCLLQFNRSNIFLKSSIYVKGVIHVDSDVNKKDNLIVSVV